MNRYRFKCNDSDPRPVTWPIPHPYWVTGYGDDYAIIVAYGDDDAYILKNWPDARNIDSDPATEYEYSSRFPEPEWMKDKK